MGLKLCCSHEKKVVDWEYLRTVLRRIFVQNRDEVIGCWRKLCIEELYNLCSSPNIVKISQGAFDGLGM
jgi:hypothetical protein